VTITPGIDQATEAAALGELVRCESVAQVAAWTARWCAKGAGADGALVWVPHAANPQFLCVGAWGEGTDRALRRAAPRDEGTVHRLIRDREAAAFGRAEIAASDDPWFAAIPSDVQSCIAVPLLAGRSVIGIVALLFRRKADLEESLERIDGIVRHAAPALARVLSAEQKRVGMLQAIERLTNLYDLGKAFTSTIDLEELSHRIAQKAADFASAEVASLWTLQTEQGEVVLAATAINERFAPEEPPEAVGSEIVGDVLADRASVMRNGVDLREGTYAIGSVLALPLLDGEEIAGALVIANKRGRRAEFTPADEELIADLGRQAVRALHNARLYEAERKVEELDALLAVSREITSTLDLGRVLKTIVNASSALIDYERCAIALLQRGSFRIGAVSGVLEVDRKDADTRRLEDLLQWVFFSGSEIAVVMDEEGNISHDRPETAEKFRAYFEASGMRSFFATLLEDEEGRLGVLSFESREPLQFDGETHDLLQILRNQATVAVRNAQLYQQMPLAGVLKPLARATRFEARWAIGIIAALLLLLIVPWPVRVEGPARVLPATRIAVTAPVDGVIDSVVHREGDRLAPGDIIATLRDDGYRAALAAAQSELHIAESELARLRLAGDAAAMFAAQSRSDAARARIDLAQQQLDRTKIRAAAAGVLLTPDLEERIGQFLRSGSELAVIGNLRQVDVDVAVPEIEASMLRTGEPVALKIHPYPTRTYRGVITRIGAAVHEEGKERFVIAESRVENADGALRAGMLGDGKVRVATRPVLFAMLRAPVRWVWLKLWPLLP